MNQDKFIEELTKLGITLTSKQQQQLHIYYELLVEWNKVMNLTNIIEQEAVYLKHFYDSLTITKVYNLNQTLLLCDIGTGAGFPGLVLKIVFPNLNVTLIDSLNKRITFLNTVIQKLELVGIKTIHARIEDYGQKNRELYDIVTARAVAPLNILLEYCIPLLKIQGHFIPLKGNLENELIQSKNALNQLNCKIIQSESFKLPIEDSNRTILKIQKLKKTSERFPRKYSEIKRNPL